jgi:hypothetical protein
VSSHERRLLLLLKKSMNFFYIKKNGHLKFRFLASASCLLIAIFTCLNGRSVYRRMIHLLNFLSLARSVVIFISNPSIFAPPNEGNRKRNITAAAPISLFS